MVKCSTESAPVGLRTHDLDIADVRIIGVLRTEAEIPHHLGCDLRIVRVEQRKRLARNVILQLALVIEADLRGVLLGCRLVGRRPFESLGRRDLDPHPLFDEVEVSRTHEVRDR